VSVIVGIFRIVIGAVFLLGSFGLCFVLGAALSGLGGSAAAAMFGGVGLFLAAAIFTALVLLAGLAATLVSAHDRLGDGTEFRRPGSASGSA
jgi:hypothetical protein